MRPATDASPRPSSAEPVQDAIAAGVDPSALVEAINKAKAQRDAVRAELANQPKATLLDAAEVHAMIDSLGDVGAVIEQARPESLAKLYRDLRLEVRYRALSGRRGSGRHDWCG